jgi:IS1 family transposase
MQLGKSHSTVLAAKEKAKYIMANVLSIEDQILVLHHLVEGTSIRSTSRVTGINQRTILRLLVRFGSACRDFLDQQMRGLELRHLEVDEQWTFVQKKQGRLHDEQKGNPRIGDQYLWLAIDMDTKLIPSFIIGKRSADMARRFMVDLANRIALPTPTDTGERAGIIPQISSDGFAAYPEAVDLAFGSYCRYGQLIKDYRNAEQPGRYGPPELVGTKRREIFGYVPLDTICTSHAERVNLTTRTLLKRFTRLSLCFSKKLENLAAAVAIYMAYYNFAWQHKTLKGRTPAMAAGITSRPWSMEELYERVMQTVDA